MRHRKPETTALVRVVETGSEVALPETLLKRAKGYAAKSRSERTLTEYAKWWKKFQGWCDANGRESFPASIETVGGFMTWLASGQDRDRPLAIASINCAVSAIKFRHRSKGHAVDTDHPAIQAIWGGIRREIAKTRTIRRVKPLMDADLREMLELLRPDVPREARDAAILALGWAAAMRRSELVGLDYAELGPTEGGTGFVAIDDKGITITLMTSKASQETAQQVVIPRDFAPLIVKAVETWVQLGAVAKGSPLYRGVNGTGWSLNPQSGYLGVTWHKREEKWQASARVDGARRTLGFFDDAREAHLAHCKATDTKPAKPHEGSIGARRMDPGHIAEIVKGRVRMLVKARNERKGKKKLSSEEMEELTQAFSGHSMRAGYATSAAQRDVPTHRIKQQTRHKSDSMLSVYIREADLHKNSGLKGVGF